MVTHLVLSRVAVRYSVDSELPTKEWLTTRERYFRDFLAPNVNRQTSTNFKLLLLIDQALIARWADSFAAAITVPHEVVPTGRRWESSVDEYVHGHSSNPVITTGLDSDDVIASDFVEQVQLRIRRDAGLNFVNGAQLRLTDGRIARRQKWSNPFVSMHSTTGDWVFRTSSHKRVAARCEVDDIDGPLMWMQLIHLGNKMNTLSEMARPLSARQLSGRFALPPGVAWSAGSAAVAKLKFAARAAIRR